MKVCDEWCGLCVGGWCGCVGLDWRYVYDLVVVMVLSVGELVGWLLVCMISLMGREILVCLGVLVSSSLMLWWLSVFLLIVSVVSGGFVCVVVGMLLKLMIVMLFGICRLCVVYMCCVVSVVVLLYVNMVLGCGFGVLSSCFIVCVVFVFGLSFVLIVIL